MSLSFLDKLLEGPAGPALVFAFLLVWFFISSHDSRTIRRIVEIPFNLLEKWTLASYDWPDAGAIAFYLAVAAGAGWIAWIARHENWELLIVFGILSGALLLAAIRRALGEKIDFEANRRAAERQAGFNPVIPGWMVVLILAAVFAVAFAQAYLRHSSGE